MKGGNAAQNKHLSKKWTCICVLTKEKMKMKGNIMSKKTIVFLVGAVLFALVGITVYAATDIGQAPTNDTSITNAEVTNTEVCSQDCDKDCNRDCEKCEGCDGNCDNWDDCDRPCKGHGEGRMCGGHGDGNGDGNGDGAKCGGHGEGQGRKPGMCGGHGGGV